MSELSTENIWFYRGDYPVLRALSFALGAGQCLQIRGPNGAGKTTLLRVLAGLLRAEEGVVRWQGEATGGRDSDFLASLAYLPHQPPLKAELTGTENVHFAVGLRRRCTLEEVRAALQRVGAGAFASRPVRSLSAGQRRRVAFAALHLDPARLWLLDEPTTNLDSEGQSMVNGLLEQHLAGGGLAVAATHQPLALAVGRLVALELSGVGE
jgi:heme exporter protein A